MYGIMPLEEYGSPIDGGWTVGLFWFGVSPAFVSFGDRSRVSGRTLSIPVLLMI